MIFIFIIFYISLASAVPLQNTTDHQYTLDVESRVIENPMPTCFENCDLYFGKNHFFEFVDVISDQFDSYTGPPDEKKWAVADHSSNAFWYGRQPGLFRKKNVWVHEGHGLGIRGDAFWRGTYQHDEIFRPIAKYGYHTYTMGMVSSTKAVLYGYFEVESKTMPTQLVNAWWFSRQTDRGWFEIDVYENLHVDAAESKHGQDMRNKVKPNLHHLYAPLGEQHPNNLIASNLPAYEHHRPVAYDRHVYGLYWTKSKIQFFFNGKPYYEVPNNHWHTPLFVRFNVETNIAWQGAAPNIPKLSQHNEFYNVYYFRAWSVKWRNWNNQDSTIQQAMSTEIHNVSDTLGNVPRGSRTRGMNNPDKDATETICEVKHNAQDRDGNLEPFILHRS